MKTVSLVSETNKYKNLAFYAFPAWDDDTQKFVTGQQYLTAKELEKEPYVIPLDEGVPVTDKMKLRVRTMPTEVKTKDDVLYEFFQQVVEIANDKNSVIRGFHEFYIFDEEEYAVKDNTSAQLIFEAMKLIHENMSLTKMQEIAIYLELPVRNAAPVVVEANIKKKALTDPQRILDFFNPENEMRIFLMKLLYHGLLVKRTNKVFTKNNTFIGDSLQDAIAFLSSNKNENAQIASMLTQQLRDKEVIGSDTVETKKKLDIKEVK